MRLDLFLKKTCIVKSRTSAKTVCDRGAATVNGRAAKGSQELRVGDVVRVRFVQREVEVRVLDLPHGNIAKRDTGKYVEMLRDDAVAPVDRVLEGWDVGEDPDPNPDAATAAGGRSAAKPPPRRRRTCNPK